MTERDFDSGKSCPESEDKLGFRWVDIVDSSSTLFIHVESNCTRIPLIVSVMTVLFIPGTLVLSKFKYNAHQKNVCDIVDNATVVAAVSVLLAAEPASHHKIRQ